jgi:hypothetical protein
MGMRVLGCSSAGVELEAMMRVDMLDVFCAEQSSKLCVPLQSRGDSPPLDLLGSPLPQSIS